MSNGHKKRRKVIREAVESLGFIFNGIEISSGDHYKVHMTDNEDHTFFVFTGQSCSANQKNATLNFKQDARRASHERKGQ